jgi:GNAT superfamily N-acetyltransferase
MSEVKIRAVEPNDLPQFIELCLEHAAYERAAIEPPNVSRLQAALFSPAPRLHAWVADRTHELVGYTTATIGFSTWTAREFLHMDCLYVRDDHRGQGIGRLLLDVVIEHAAVLNIRTLQWQTPDWNVDAQRFYARLGASAAGKVRFTLAPAG